MSIYFRVESVFQLANIQKLRILHTILGFQFLFMFSNTTALTPHYSHSLCQAVQCPAWLSVEFRGKGKVFCGPMFLLPGGSVFLLTKDLCFYYQTEGIFISLFSH
jgi:hypothetical protein